MEEIKITLKGVGNKGLGNKYKATMKRILSVLIALFSYVWLPAQPFPTFNDCLGAISVCKQVYNQSSSIILQGPGTVQEMNPDFNCIHYEEHSVWYAFTVSNSGNFGFLLTPNVITDDFDWALFDITNASCEDLFENPDLLVSCNAAGGGSCSGLTGATGDTPYNIQGYYCNFSPPTNELGYTAFNALVPVKEGNTYVLCVNNPHEAINGYKIDFGLSEEIGIFDDTPPQIEEIIYPESCSEPVFEIVFSEYIKCFSIWKEDFQLLGPGGPFDLTLSSTNCDANGRMDKFFTLSVSPSLSQGDYVLIFETGAVDLCGNQALPGQFPFNTDELFAPFNLGNDTLICEGDVLVLEGSLEGSNLWKDGSEGLSFHVTTPGIYSVTVTTPCRTSFDEIVVAYIPELPSINLGADTSICPGDTLVFDIENEFIDEYLWQDGSTDPKYEIIENSLYSVTVSNACGEKSDDIQVDYIPIITANIIKDTFICEGESIQLDVSKSSATDYLWQDNSKEAVYTVRAPGVYSVILSNACETISYDVEVEACEVCNVIFPNAFSPNNDGINDYFQPISDCELLDYDFKIFDRWGALLFESQEVETGWDGLLKGKLGEVGVYVWSMSCRVIENNKSREVRRVGDILLLN